MGTAICAEMFKSIFICSDSLSFTSVPLSCLLRWINKTGLLIPILQCHQRANFLCKLFSSTSTVVPKCLQSHHHQHVFRTLINRCDKRNENQRVLDWLRRLVSVGEWEVIFLAWSTQIFLSKTYFEAVLWLNEKRLGALREIYLNGRKESKRNIKSQSSLVFIEAELKAHSNVSAALATRWSFL